MLVIVVVVFVFSTFFDDFWICWSCLTFVVEVCSLRGFIRHFCRILSSIYSFLFRFCPFHSVIFLGFLVPHFWWVLPLLLTMVFGNFLALYPAIIWAGFGSKGFSIQFFPLAIGLIPFSGDTPMVSLRFPIGLVNFCSKSGVSGPLYIWKAYSGPTFFTVGKFPNPIGWGKIRYSPGMASISGGFPHTGFFCGTPKFSGDFFRGTPLFRNRVLTGGAPKLYCGVPLRRGFYTPRDNFAGGKFFMPTPQILRVRVITLRVARRNRAPLFPKFPERYISSSGDHCAHHHI